MPAKSNRSFHRSASLKLALPATSANLGPAFDTAALALGLFLKIRAHVSDQFSITARGRDADLCAQLENHLILTAYSEILQRESKRIQPLALHIENEIPIGKGCGSSAAARLAGIDRKSTRLNSSHTVISYAVFCLKKKSYSKNLG